jgi:hypothetical protein
VGCLHFPYEGSRQVRKSVQIWSVLKYLDARSAGHVIEVYDLLKRHEIDIWIDGRWGVDALLGEHTREHGDLDIAIQAKDLPKMRALLEEPGYQIKVRSMLGLGTSS